jgi:hypothetical protein
VGGGRGGGGTAAGAGEVEVEGGEVEGEVIERVSESASSLSARSRETSDVERDSEEGSDMWVVIGGYSKSREDGNVLVGRMGLKSRIGIK